MKVICKKIGEGVYTVVESEDKTISIGNELSDNWFEMNGYECIDFDGDMYEFSKPTMITIGDIKELYEDCEYSKYGTSFEDFLDMYLEDDDFKVINDLSCSQIRKEELSEEDI